MNTENQEMEQFQAEENKVEKEIKTLEITDEVTTQLDGAGKWGKFLAILGFVFLGLLVMAGVVMSFVFAIIPKNNFTPMPFPSFLFGLIYLVMGIIYFFPVLFLFRFSTGINNALLFKNQDQLVNAFKNLKALYRFIGIFMIVGLVLYLLAFIIMIFAGVFAGFSSVTGGMHA